MKKLFALLLVLILIVSAISAFAEERFSVRNGIMFGMTKDDVIKTEEDNGNTKYEEDQEENSIEYNPNSVAGIEGGIVNYVFNNNKLDIIEYVWSDRIDNYKVENTQDYYTTLKMTLEEKYIKIGEMYNSNKLTGIDIDKVNEKIEFPGQSGYYNIDVKAYDEYLAKDNTDYVVIVLESYKIDAVGIITNVMTVKYISVNGDVVDSIINKANKSIEQRNTDL